MDVLIQWMKDSAAEYSPKLLTAVATLVIGWLLAKLLTGALRRVLRGAQMDPTLAGFCASLTYVALLALVVITALDRFGFPAISFAAVIGAAGLAVGLALKNTLSNFAAGVMLIALRPFNLGDRIEAAGVAGVVLHIQVFSTTIDAGDGKRIIVPNAALLGGNIVNFSKG